MNSEELAFQIISIAGDGMGLYFKALEEAKKGNFEESDTLFNQATAKIKEAHKIQSNALFSEARGEKLRDEYFIGSCSGPFNELYIG